MTEDANEDKVFKLNQAPIREEINREVALNADKFRDPVVLGTLISMLISERENTNRVLKTLVEKIERLENALAEGKAIKGQERGLMLPDVDEAIVQFLKDGPKTAENVQVKFGYKGRNAASARLNRLHLLGVVVKKNVGKKVFFSLA